MMRLSTVLGIRRRRIRNRIFTLGFIITGMLSIAFAVVTFYGQNAGNFVMTVDQALLKRGIMLSDTEDLSVKSSDLMSDPIEEAREVTYNWLKLDEIEATDGNFVDEDHQYISYTFYLHNEGEETVDISYYIRVVDSYKDIQSAIRILVIEDGVQTMYMQEDEVETVYPGNLPRTEYFLPTRNIVEKMIYNFRPDQTKKFSIVIWLEGYDLDTNDEIIGGMIELIMNFSIYKPE
jgi:hypothetical protein